MHIKRKAHLVRSCNVANVFWIWLLMSFALPVTANEDQAGRCEQMDTTDLKSPDGVWIARVYGEVCDQGLMTSASVAIDLVRADNVGYRQSIFGMTMPPKHNDWPRVTWPSAKKVIVRVPSSAEIGLQMAYFQGVEVDVHFCPGGPAERARWLEYGAAYRRWSKETTAWIEKKKRDPASVGPQPVRPAPPAPAGKDPACAQ